MRGKIFFLIVIVFSLLLVGCSDSKRISESTIDLGTDGQEVTSSGGDDSSGIKTVVIENFKFSPAEVTINAGDTVEWINKDSVSHTVTFEDARFDVDLPSGASTNYTFTQEGEEARYFCQYHPSMQGAVFVN